VTNQFGTFSVAALRPVRLLVPASKSLSGPPAPLAGGLDHFECYRIRGGRVPGVRVTFTDQFATGTERLLRADQLCVPVSKNGETIPDPNAKLVCYTTLVTAGSPPVHGPRVPVFVNDQLGPETLDFVNHPHDFCVPSS